MSTEKESLYKTIYNHFKDKILSGELKNGEKISTESRIMSDFGVSRITATRALDSLENDGYISRIQGSGSYVSFSDGNKTGGQIGFVVPDFSDFPYMRIISGISKALEGSGYVIVFYRYNTDVSETLQKAMQECKGIIYYPTINKRDCEALARLKEQNYPVVILDKIMTDPDLSCVVSNSVKGAEMLTELLIEKGHRKIAFISPSPVMEHTSAERYLGCCKAFSRAGLPVENVKYYPLFGSYEEHSEFYSHVSDEEYIKQFYTSFIKDIYNQGYTGFVCINDWMALAVLKYAGNAGFSVPDDIAVTGFDNIPLAEFSSPALTTAAQDYIELGYLAATDVISLIEKRVDAPLKRIVPVSIVVRGTV